MGYGNTIETISTHTNTPSGNKLLSLMTSYELLKTTRGFHLSK